MTFVRLPMALVGFAALTATLRKHVSPHLTR